MLRCRACDCLCDPADTVNGICDDCRAEREYKESKREEAERIMTAEFRQMDLSEVFGGNRLGIQRDSGADMRMN